MKVKYLIKDNIWNLIFLTPNINYWGNALFQLTLLGEGKATQATLAWKITWMEEPGRLQSMGPQRVGHD